MAEFHVAELFSSVNGEGTRSGQLALFIRMRGCNLACAYCDTRWANEPDAPDTVRSAEEIAKTVRDCGIRNVTLTGGEPLLAEGIETLLAALAALPGIRVEIETNGSVPLRPLLAGMGERDGRIAFTMDYKLPGSGMEEHMCPDNFAVLAAWDTVKFVVRDRADLARSLALIMEHGLTGRCHVFLSPVFGVIRPAEIADFMKEHRMNDVTLQLQIHKIIWDSGQSGV